MRERAEIDAQYIWDVASLFKDAEAWSRSYDACLAHKTETLYWPQLATRDITTSEDLHALLSEYFAIERSIEKLYTYAHLKHDEDVADEKYKQIFEKSSTLIHRFSSETSWIHPAILALDEAIVNQPVLSEYRAFLRKIFHLKPHTLSQEKEHLFSLSSKALGTSQSAFSVFNNVDLQFTPAQTETGEEKPLTHGSYSRFIQSSDRTLRQTAFQNIHRAFASFENTVSELLAGHVHAHVFAMRARGYGSCLEASLYPHNIDPKVYRTLIDTVHAHIGSLHEYIALRKKALGVETLHPYDLHVGLTSEIEKKYSYDEAVECTIEAVAPLGAEYQKALADGLRTQRWADVFETPRKRSGAYSSGCYDSHPFMLLNFEGTLRDVMTLAHEAGHSMHSYYANRQQPYHDAGYPIFVAEVASTFNEELLFRTLLDKAQTNEERAYLLNRKIDDIRATLFRQTQFAEFELQLHEMAEHNVPITAPALKQKYGELNALYYGPALQNDEEVHFEYLRIPHFYANFYVYQYATGIAAAHALVRKVLEEGAPAREKYLSFLSSGGSKYPLELLREAGVDMTTSEPTEILLSEFRSLTQELARLF